MKSLHWFRADLRVTDNTALTQAIDDSSEVIALYIISEETWLAHDAAPIKIQFILENLVELSRDLEDKGIPLLIREVATFDECPKVIATLCREYSIETLFFNKQYEVDEDARDEAVCHMLRGDVEVKSFDDQLVIPPGALMNKQGAPFKVFTPFKKTWLQIAEATHAWHVLRKPSKTFKTSLKPDPIPKELKHFDLTFDLTAWPAGEKAAIHRLRKYCQTKMTSYHETRDFPYLDATSQISPYLAQGVISPRQCVSRALATINAEDLSSLGKDKGASVWVSEVIWREFYKHIMFHFKEVCRYKPFKTETDNIPWRYDEEKLTAWCDGKTGFPFVDAAMRQLKATGWMHNRVRMVVAMFFTKTLLLDWRLGEKHFMQHLIDGDLASNNGGWQWSASTGTDAAPYFRIFNPTTQSERFDPDGIFIRKYCPELAKLDNKSIHAPYAHGVSPDEIDYPKPIEDYKKMREVVIKLFKKL